MKLLTPEQLAEIIERHRRDSNECADVKDADEIHNDRGAIITALEAAELKIAGLRAPYHSKLEAAEASITALESENKALRVGIFELPRFIPHDENESAVVLWDDIKNLLKQEHGYG